MRLPASVAHDLTTRNAVFSSYQHIWRYGQIIQGIMDLWDRIRPLVMSCGLMEQYFKIIYSDETVFCLRVMFPKWIEHSILNISPTNFVRGLTNEAQRKIVKLMSCKELSSQHPKLLLRLQSLRKQLNSVSASLSDTEDLYNKFVQCLKTESDFILKNSPMHNDNDNILSIPIVSKIDNLHQEFGMCNTIVQIQNEIFTRREKINEIMDRLKTNEENVLLSSLERNIGESIANFEDWHGQLLRATQGMIDPNYLLMHSPNEALATIKDLYNEEGGRLISLKQTMENKLHEIIDTLCNLLKDLSSYSHCNFKMHQALGNGCEVSRVHPPNTHIKQCDHITQMQTFVEKILTLINEIKPVIRSAITTFNVERIRQLNEQLAPNFQCDAITPTALTTTFIACHQRLDEFELALYQKFSLIIEQQPEQVLKTESVPKTPTMSVSLLNFHNRQTNPITLEICLINESQAKQIMAAGTLPERISMSGTLKKVTSENVCSNRTGTRRKRAKPSQQCPHSSSTVPSSLSPRPNHHGAPIQEICNNASSSLKFIFNSLSLDLPLRVVNRPRTSSSTENSQKVAQQKFCFLLMADIPIENKVAKAFTMSLPVVITTHGSQNEDAWATIAFDNASAVIESIGFEINPVINWWQTKEMLQGLFNKWVGTSLTMSHVKHLKSKLQAHIGKEFPNEIPWSSISKEKNRDGYSFWSYFYKSAMIVQQPCFKEAWENGYVEGFISWEDASDLLKKSNVKPGTFILRFSDTQEGCLTTVFITHNEQTHRLQPTEVYKKHGITDCSRAFLGMLNVKCQNSEDMFCWVYPNICKKKAFKSFYDLPQTDKKPHYVLVKSVVVPFPTNVSSPEFVTASTSGTEAFVNSSTETTRSRSTSTSPSASSDSDVECLVNEDQIMGQSVNSFDSLMQDLMDYEVCFHFNTESNNEELFVNSFYKNG